jgi:uncharacterized OsmC-like protein
VDGPILFKKSIVKSKKNNPVITQIRSRLTGCGKLNYGKPMKSEELRSIQKPLKEQYREQPNTAMITLKAHGKVGEGVTCSIQTGKALVEAGLHPATGGTGMSVCSGDMLLEALVACAGVTLASVSTALEINIRDAVVRAEGDLDFRGTLGVSKETPVGFQNIRLHFDLDTDASEEQISKLIALTERYCVVFQTLRQSPQMSVLPHTVQ